MICWVWCGPIMICRFSLIRDFGTVMRRQKMFVKKRGEQWIMPRTWSWSMSLSGKQEGDFKKKNQRFINVIIIIIVFTIIIITLNIMIIVVIAGISSMMSHHPHHYVSNHRCHCVVIIIIIVSTCLGKNWRGGFEQSKKWEKWKDVNALKSKFWREEIALSISR